MALTNSQRSLLGALPDAGEPVFCKGPVPQNLAKLGYARKVRDAVWAGGYYVRTPEGKAALEVSR